MAGVLLYVALLAGLAVAAPPVVSNVWFGQREGQNIVDIWYDLSDPDGDPALSVSVLVSTDGGSSFNIGPRTTSGDIGPGQSTGRKKHIIWDAGKDHSSLSSKRCVVRVLADDGVAVRPEGMNRQGRQETPSGAKTGSGEENRQGRTPSTPSGNERVWEKDGAVMVRVPAGTFTMGSNDGDSDEKPVHDVYVDEFWIDKYEVTNRQYKQFCDARGRAYPDDPDFLGMPNYFENRPDYPVVNVSWEDAKAYCDWAGKRLPTETEWEKAARGTNARKYPWGNGAPDGSRCNYADKNTSYSWRDAKVDDGYARTAPVGSFPAGASPYGALDMAGNVWEWCADWYKGDYSGGASNNPTGPSSGSSRVIRGGSWCYGATVLRCSDRYGFGPSLRDDDLGFRCVAR